MFTARFKLSGAEPMSIVYANLSAITLVMLWRETKRWSATYSYPSKTAFPPLHHPVKKPGSGLELLSQ